MAGNEVIRFWKAHSGKCKAALLANIFLVVLGFVLTLFYLWITLKQNEYFDGNERWVAWGLGIGFLGFDVVLALAVFSMARGNKLSKLFFMLIYTFGMVFSAGFALKGLIFLIFMVSGLATNIMCYNQLHPRIKE